MVSNNKCRHASHAKTKEKAYQYGMLPNQHPIMFMTPILMAIFVVELLCAILGNKSSTNQCSAITEFNVVSGICPELALVNAVPSSWGVGARVGVG
ncbi:hypothetical protein BC938DRAFT_482721 [Jimgerdemannia flammicorona]|uniref:Uncharacterized protein n=1 Tax=Jimgerdemannia flammicorona TaxID=994334 RepID=A0A433QDE4_9FUNG|nr:hypothetical protein BC938DRAFT_482721 [Jimgerdemannia flammicorona]